MVDYPFYEDQWRKIVEDTDYFITANFRFENFDGKSNIEFDHGGILRDKIDDARTEGRLKTKKCMAGRIPLYLHWLQNN